MPPCLGIVFIFLISNWYVWIFSIGAILVSLGLQKLGVLSRTRGWFAYENASVQTESPSTPIQLNSEWEYRSTTLDIIQEENKIT